MYSIPLFKRVSTGFFPLNLDFCSRQCSHWVEVSWPNSPSSWSTCLVSCCNCICHWPNRICIPCFIYCLQCVNWHGAYLATNIILSSGRLASLSPSHVPFSPSTTLVQPRGFWLVVESHHYCIWYNSSDILQFPIHTLSHSWKLEYKSRLTMLHNYLLNGCRIILQWSSP